MPVDPNSSTDRCVRKMSPPSEADIKVIIQREFEKRDHRYETQRSIWSKLGITIVPAVIAFFIYTANLDKRITLLESQQGIIVELRKEIREINTRLYNIEIFLARQQGLGEKNNE